MKPVLFSCLGLVTMISLAACSRAVPMSPADTVPPTQTSAQEPVSRPSPSPMSGKYATPSVTATNQPASTATIRVLSTNTPRPTATSIPTFETGRSITLTALSMFDETSGWGIEATGHIVRTTDGGSSWQDFTPPQGQYESGGFFARDANTAWATPYQTVCFTFNCPPGPKSTIIWRTVDGGRTWQPSRTLCLGGDCGYDYYTGPVYLETIAMQFVDENTGWILVTVDHNMFQDRYRVYRTIDGGENWKMVSDSGGGPYMFEATGLAFLNDQTGWFGSSQVDGATSPKADWSIHRTRDAGVTWETVKLPPPANLPADFTGHTIWCGVKNVGTIPPQVVDLTISCKVYLEDAGPDKRPHYNFHYHSLDGGKTWRSWQTIGNMSFVNAALGWRLFSPDPARPNQLQKTTDSGLNWVDVKAVAWQSAQFDFITGQVGWAIVSNGNATALVGTIDGGKTWVDLGPRGINSQ